MSMRLLRNPLIAFGIFIALEAIYPLEAWARAGGGQNSGGRSGGIINLILYPIVIAYSLFATYLAYSKHRQSLRILEKAKVDSFWDPDVLRDRIQDVFFKVQEAWMKRNQQIAKNYMSERLYSEHKQQTDAMIQNKTCNILEDIHLIRVRIVEVLDYSDNSKDQFWTLVEGKMIDYTINESNTKVISGNKDKPQAFKELWKFKRAEKNWVLDEIDSSVGVGDLFNMESFSQSAVDESSSAAD